MRRLLLILHLIVGLNALGGSYYGLAGAPDVPLEWLKGSPFSDYFIPSLVLLTVVGGSHFWAVLSLFLKQRSSFLISTIAGVILFFWILVQIYMIGYVSWLQPTMVILSICILVIARLGSKADQQQNEVFK